MEIVKLNTLPSKRWYFLNKDKFELGKIHKSNRRFIIHKPKRNYSDKLKEAIFKAL